MPCFSNSNHHHLGLSLCALCVGSLCMASPAPAADSDNSAPNSLQLNTIVVTGTRTERTLLDVPVRTEVITREQIEKNHARDLAEALRYQPGIQIREIHGKSGYSAWMQGVDSDRVLVLVNGRPVSASTGTTVDLTQLAVGDIDHIEVVKGSVSALYGSQAMGGVINIITRRPAADFTYSLMADAGSYGEKDMGTDSFLNDRHLLADLSHKFGNWNARLSADLRDSDGFDLDPDTFAHEGDRGPKTNVNAELAYLYGEGNEISLSPGYYREEINHYFTEFAPGVGDIRLEKRELAERRNATLAFRHQANNENHFSGYFIHEVFDDHTEQDILSTPSVDQTRDTHLTTQKAELQWDTPVGDNQLWSLGLVDLDESLTQTNDGIDGKTRHNIEAFVQDDIFIGEHWEMLPGFRVQQDSDFGDHMSPKLNFMFSPEWFDDTTTRIRFGYGHGYRVPSLKERHFIFDHSHLGYMVIGSPDLLPEDSQSYQAGIEFTYADGTHTDISLFHNDITDLISEAPNPDHPLATPGLLIFEYVNVEHARTRGIDFTQSIRLGKNLTGNLGYSFLEGINVDTGNTLVKSPEHQFKLSLDYHLAMTRTDLTLNGVYQSKEYVDAENTIVSPEWSQLDLKINQPLAWVEGLTVFFGIDNINDVHKKPDLGGEDFRPKKGRFIYTGFRIKG